jgi:hypothetical protein
MPRRIRYEEDESAPAPGGVRSVIRSLAHTAGTLAVLAVMLYAAALAISRTGGFRSYVQAEISESLGFDVAVLDARLTPGLALVIEGITAGRFDAPGTPCVRADRATIDWSLFPSGGSRLRSIAVETGQLAFAQGADGSWTPRPLADVAEALVQGSGLGLDGIRAAVRKAAGASAPPVAMVPRSAAPPTLPARRVTVRGVDVIWWKADRSTLASLTGLDVEITPVEVPGRRMLHILAGAKSFARAGGEWISPLQIECLWGGGERILLNAAAGAPPAAGLGPIPGIGDGRPGAGSRE